MILSCDNVYAMIGQRQGGVLGFIQKTVSKCAHHIWFERSQAKDRNLVRQALKEHVEDPDKNPILIFPEGTCINNTSVMLFKKGSFEVSSCLLDLNFISFRSPISSIQLQCATITVWETPSGTVANKATFLTLSE
jgi:hypothetical protein